MIHWLMSPDGSFHFTYPQLAANSYYQLLDDTSHEDIDDNGDTEYVTEAEVDPYDELFSGHDALKPYSNDVIEDRQTDYNIVRF